MGRMNAEGMAETGLPLSTLLTWHLQHNHYPPVPLSMIDPCIAAIDAANDDDWNADIELPEGVSYRGSVTAPAWAIVEQHHLDSFIDDEGGDL